MSSAQIAAFRRKEQKYTAVAIGDLPVHLYKLPSFQSKISKGRKISLVVPGEIVQELFREECTIFINRTRETNCASRKNIGYITICKCSSDIRDEDILSASVSMLNFFIIWQHWRDVRIQDQIPRGKMCKKIPRYLKLVKTQKGKKKRERRGSSYCCVTCGEKENTGVIFMK